MDKSVFINMLKGLQRLQGGWKTLYPTGTVVGQFWGPVSWNGFCTNDPVDIQQLIHKRFCRKQALPPFLLLASRIFFENSKNINFDKKRFGSIFLAAWLFFSAFLRFLVYLTKEVYKFSSSS